MLDVLMKYFKENFKGFIKFLQGKYLSQIIDNESIMETTMKTLNQSNMMNESSINV